MHRNAKRCPHQTEWAQISSESIPLPDETKIRSGHPLSYGDVDCVTAYPRMGSHSVTDGLDRVLLFLVVLLTLAQNGATSGILG